jgi:hypothetical protein
MASRDEQELTDPVDNTANLPDTATEDDRISSGTISEVDHDGSSYTEENVEYDIDDDPCAEGDDPVAVKPVDPSYKNANAIPFFFVCKKMEHLWQMRGKTGKKVKYKPNEEQKLLFFLPPKLMQSLAKPNDDRTPESIFPLFRLIMPAQDSSRSVMLKERLLAKIYGEAFGMKPGTGDRKKLEIFWDKSVTGEQGVGDFSVVLQKVIEKRVIWVANQGSKLTVGEINTLLDELASLSGKAKRPNPPINSKTNKPMSLHDLRVAWICKV